MYISELRGQKETACMPSSGYPHELHHDLLKMIALKFVNPV